MGKTLRTFQTDDEVYHKFKMWCIYDEMQLGDKITELMKGYVMEKEPKKEGLDPYVEGGIITEIPTVFANPQSWINYIQSIDRKAVIKHINRFHFLDLLGINEYLSLKKMVHYDNYPLRESWRESWDKSGERSALLDNRIYLSGRLTLNYKTDRHQAGVPTELWF